MYTDESILIGCNDDTCVMLPPKLANRHGIVAGATGTGKTYTLKALAESFSDMGVPVFVADMKGDLAGLAKAGEANENVSKRVEKYDLQSKGFSYRGYPVEFWDLFGDKGLPIRVTISQMGPILLSKILKLSEAQAGVLNIVFKVADSESLLLIDIKDLKSMINYVTENRVKYESQYGAIATKSANTILRSLLTLEEQGGNKFFGEPALELNDFMQCDDNGKGIINVFDSVKLSLAPDLYSTFLLWMLTEMFESMPEVGDLEKPKFVFFFDEAHLLFDDMNPTFQRKIEQIVRLIRSKGIGLYFITQSPTDIPDEILSQLGNRIQHALRAYTPKDQKAVKVAAETFRANPKFDTADEISNLGIGQALVSVLDKEGVPTVVEKVDIIPPQCYSGAIEDSYREEIVNISLLKEKYMEAFDRESAYEVLLQKIQQAPVQQMQQNEGYDAQQQNIPQDYPPADNTNYQNQEQIPQQEKQSGFQISDVIRDTMDNVDMTKTTKGGRTTQRAAGKSEIEKIASSAVNTVVREASRQIIRGIFGQIKLK